MSLQQPRAPRGRFCKVAWLSFLEVSPDQQKRLVPPTDETEAARLWGDKWLNEAMGMLSSTSEHGAVITRMLSPADFADIDKLVRAVANSMLKGGEGHPCFTHGMGTPEALGGAEQAGSPFHWVQRFRQKVGEEQMWDPYPDFGVPSSTTEVTFRYCDVVVHYRDATDGEISEHLASTESLLTRASQSPFSIRSENSAASISLQSLHAPFFAAADARVSVLLPDTVYTISIAGQDTARDNNRGDLRSQFVKALLPSTAPGSVVFGVRVETRDESRPSGANGSLVIVSDARSNVLQDSIQDTDPGRVLGQVGFPETRLSDEDASALLSQLGLLPSDSSTRFIVTTRPRGAGFDDYQTVSQSTGTVAHTPGTSVSSRTLYD